MGRNRIADGSVLLLVSGAIVGLAVALGGDVGRALNGIGGIGWMLGAGLLVAGLRQSPSRRCGYGVAVVGALGLSWFVSASDVTAAVMSFGLIGACVALVTADRRSAWALLVPALWLPLHIGSAIVRAAVAGEGRVRTEPPPTAALVPLAMIVAAWGGGWLVERMVARRPTSAVHRVLEARR